jgi:formylglycine-generating enzyme required for sulfatase activity
VVTLPLDWVEIPAGTLNRGTPEGELSTVLERHRDLDVSVDYFRKETPRTQVHVRAFAITRVPVTRYQWNRFAPVVGFALAPEGHPDFPMDGVKWHEAVVFCEWVSEQNGVTIRLPAEDEWERAARGDDAREYPWGDNWDPGAANTVELDIGTYLPVGSLPAGSSPFGVFDLAGNADEWTSTVYAPYPGASDGVPVHETWALDEHVTRGGGYYQQRDLARCARRHGVYEGRTGAGFRLAGDA